MKRLWSAVSFLLVVPSAEGGAPHDAPGNGNPLVPGYFADPTIRKFGETFCLYATTDGSGGGRGPSQVWTSRDFVNWTLHPAGRGAGVAGPMLLGGGAGSQAFAGAIASVRVYNRQLAASEIAWLKDVTCRRPADPAPKRQGLLVHLDARKLHMRTSADGTGWVEMPGSPVVRKDMNGLAAQVGCFHAMDSANAGSVAYEYFRLSEPKTSTSRPGYGRCPGRQCRQPFASPPRREDDRRYGHYDPKETPHGKPEATGRGCPGLTKERWR